MKVRERLTLVRLWMMNGLSRGGTIWVRLFLPLPFLQLRFFNSESLVSRMGKGGGKPPTGLRHSFRGWELLVDEELGVKSGIEGMMDRRNILH